MSTSAPLRTRLFDRGSLLRTSPVLSLLVFVAVARARVFPSVLRHLVVRPLFPVLAAAIVLLLAITLPPLAVQHANQPRSMFAAAGRMPIHPWT